MAKINLKDIIAGQQVKNVKSYNNDSEYKKFLTTIKSRSILIKH